MIKPFYQDEAITLYHGDCREILPQLGQQFGACITDPPYEETGLPWDRWPGGWPAAVALSTRSLWCFGSLRMFMAQQEEFSSWKLSHDVVWEKHNGSAPVSDRFRRVHELAAHFYAGEWADLYKEPQFTYDATPRRASRGTGPAQWGAIGHSSYATDAGGPRFMRSVIYARNCNGNGVHPTQKPAAILGPLINYSAPPGGVLLDCFAGSGETLLTARKLGRRAVGIEIGREWCDLIVDRLRQGTLDV